MARKESSQQIDLQQGTVYSLQMKWLDAHTHTHTKKSLLEEQSAI